MDENTISVDLTIKSHPIDRIINLHQSVSLSIIRKQNHLMLKAQYTQCQQMQQLQREMQINNSITRQILENQLKEIQHQENLKYYKALAYNIREAVNVIGNTEDLVFKSFLNHLFHDVLKLHLQEAKENLEEISDKVFCSEIENALEANTEETLAAEDKYSKSNFHTLLDAEKDYNEQYAQLLEKRKSLIFLEYEYTQWIAKYKAHSKSKPVKRPKIKKPKIRKLKIARPKPYKNPFRILGIVVFGIWSSITFMALCFEFPEPSTALAIFLFFVLPELFLFVILIRKEKKWRRNYLSYLEDFKQKQELKKAMQEEKEKSMSKIEEMPAPEPPKESIPEPASEEIAYLTAKKEYDELETQLKVHPYTKAKYDLSQEYPTWDKVLEKITSCLPPLKEPEKKSIKTDSLLYEVAKFIVSTQKVSSSAIQRKFSFGYNRTVRIMEQLEGLKIIRSGKILFTNVELLNEYWERMNL